MEQTGVRAKVLPDEGCTDSKELLKRKALLEKMTSAMFETVDTEIRGLWLRNRGSQSATLQALLPDEPPRAFWVEHYYEIIATVVASPLTVALQKNTSTGSTVVSSDIMLAGSTSLRSAPGNSSPAPGPPPTLIGVQALMHDSGFDLQETVHITDTDYGLVGCHTILTKVDVGVRVTYEGKIVSYSAEPREITPQQNSQSPRKRKGLDESQTVQACDLLLLDNTGPVCVTSWGDMVSQFYARINDSPASFIRLTAMRVAGLKQQTSWNGTSITTMRVLHSAAQGAGRAGTTLTLLQNPTSRYLLEASYEPPVWPVCVIQFSMVRSKLQAPCRVTLRGIICELSEKQLSLSESVKRTFILVDEAGMWIRCCAVGLPARSLALSHGNEVVLYYGLGRAGLGSTPGMIYFLKDSLFVQVGYRADPIVRRAEITVDVAAS